MPTSAISLLALHGAFGTPSFWDSFRAHWTSGQAPLTTPDLWTLPVDPEPTLARLAKGRPTVLLGYSLGGRLALRALVAHPEAFAGAVLIGAHPGLVQEAERAIRRQHDSAWAERFERTPWPLFWAEWNRQPVLAEPTGATCFWSGAIPAAPPTMAVRALRQWSLGHQEDLWPHLETLGKPILWIAGERDAKFRGLAERAAQSSPFAQLALAPASGHRVPLEAPQWLAGTVADFLACLQQPLAT